MLLPQIYIQIPHYNNSSFIRESIESVLNLDYTNYFIKFINDHSTDDTNLTLKSIDFSNKFEVIHNSERKGRVNNYRYAFSLHGTAEWFVNLDSDDYYINKSWLKESMEIAAQNPQDNITHIQCNFLARIGIDHIQPIKSFNNGFYLISGYDYVKLCIQHYGFSHLSSIFNVKFAKKFGAYSDDCLHTDFLTAARSAIQGNVLIGSHEIGVWRKHDGNQSSQRYSKNEYAKNQVAYYKFFEWGEDFLSYDQIISLIGIFENREMDRKLVSSIQTRNINEILTFYYDEKPSILSIIKSLNRVFLSDLDSEKLFNISHGVSTRIVSVIITLTTLPFILNYLGVSDYSWIGIYTAIASAIYIFDFGLTNLITKEISQDNSKSEHKRKSIIASQELVYLTVGILIFLLIYLSSEWLMINWLYITNGVVNNKNILSLIALAILVQWPHSFYTGALYGLRKQTVSNYSQLGITIIKNLGILVLFHYLKPSIELFFYWNIVISLLTIVMQKYFIYREVQFVNPLKYFSWPYINQLKKLAFGISIISLFGFIYSDINNFLLARWLSKTDFGYYSILYNILIAYIMYCATIKSALFPYISKLVSGSILYIQSNYFKHSQIISFSLIPLSAFLFIFRNEVLTVWLNQIELTIQLSASFGWIIIGSVCNSLMIIPWTYLIAMSKTRFLVLLAGLLALISVPLLYFIIRQFLFEGASIYWLVINALPLPFLILYFNRQVKISTSNLIYQTILLPIFISSPLFLIAKFFTDFLNFSNIVSLGIGFSVLFLSYITLLISNYFIVKHKI
jgi:O-antigen/teichoic acid export membrane protein